MENPPGGATNSLIRYKILYTAPIQISSLSRGPYPSKGAGVKGGGGDFKFILTSLAIPSLLLGVVLSPRTDMWGADTNTGYKGTPTSLGIVRTL